MSRFGTPSAGIPAACDYLVCVVFLGFGSCKHVLTTCVCCSRETHAMLDLLALWYNEMIQQLYQQFCFCEGSYYLFVISIWGTAVWCQRQEKGVTSGSSYTPQRKGFICMINKKREIKMESFSGKRAEQLTVCPRPSLSFCPDWFGGRRHCCFDEGPAELWAWPSCSAPCPPARRAENWVQSAASAPVSCEDTVSKDTNVSSLTAE